MFQGNVESIVKTVFVVFILVLLLFTLYWIFQNRDSEKVVSNILPAAAVGTLGAFLTLLLSLKVETREVEFPAVFIFDASSKEPFQFPIPPSFDPDLRLAWSYAKAVIEKDPSFLGAQTTDKGTELYFDVLLRMVLDVFFGLYNTHWDIKFRSIDLPYITRRVWSPQESAPQRVEFVTLENIAKWFPNVQVLGIHRLPFEKMAVPPRTKITGNTEFSAGDPPRPFVRNIVMENPFVKLNISLASVGGNIGLGKAALLLGYSQEDNSRFWTALYTIQLSAQFKRFRSGHPEMPKYRRWVDIMFEQLQTHFDAKRHWEQARDQYLLFKDKMSEAPSKGQNAK